MNVSIQSLNVCSGWNAGQWPEAASPYICGLLSIERPDGRKMKADVLGRAAERMKMVIQGSLRASDISPVIV